MHNCFPTRHCQRRRVTLAAPHPAAYAHAHPAHRLWRGGRHSHPFAAALGRCLTLAPTHGLCGRVAHWRCAHAQRCALTLRFAHGRSFTLGRGQRLPSWGRLAFRRRAHGVARRGQQWQRVTNAFARAA